MEFQRKLRSWIFEVGSLQDYGARFYDPKLSRFLSVDPLAGKFPGHSPYNYVENNPLRYTDPTGMEKDDIIFNVQLRIKQIQYGE